MNPMWAMTLKELKLFARDPGGLVMLFVLPALFIIVLSVALQGAFSTRQGEEKIDLLMVDEAGGKIGELLTQAAERTGIFRTVSAIEDKPLHREEATTLIQQGKAQLAIIIPTAAASAMAFETDDSIEILADPVVSREILIAIENALQQVLHVSLIEVFFHELEQISAERARFAPTEPSICDAQTPDEDWAVSCQSANYAGERGLVVRQRYVAGQPLEQHPDVVQQNVPGWTIFALFWIAQVLCLNIMNERNTGAYFRILVSPTTFFQYLMGKTIPFVLMNLLQAVCMFAIGVFVLPLLGCAELEMYNLSALALITVAISAVAIGFGLLATTFTKSVAFTSSILAATIMIMCVVGGIMVPKFIMPQLMQQLSLLVPQGWALDAYQDILVRKQDTTEILPEVGILAMFAVLFFAIALFRIRRQSRSF